VVGLNAGKRSLDNLQVSGLIDIVAYRECGIVINDEGRINESPVNVRVSHWVLRDSQIDPDAMMARPDWLFLDFIDL
jgi:hypothetical protein